MKKALLTLLLLIGFMASCQKHTTIVVEDDIHYLRIEYAGTVVFNDDNTGILRISNGGYFKCKNNYDKLRAETDSKGRMVYEVNGNDATTKLTSTGEKLMKEAVREIARQHGKKTDR